MLLFISFRPSFLSGHPVVSIHLMLLFIKRIPEPSALRVKFQYISCYSLSYFKTNRLQVFNMFQYISCYSLSFERESIRLNSDSFQYISCYSLSFRNRQECAKFVRFNTSHVTLYPSFYRLFFF